MTFGMRQVQKPSPEGKTPELETEMVLGKKVQDEKRAEPRHRVLKGGNIFFNKGYGAYDCVLKNLSDSGALIKMEDSSGIPGVFDFTIKGEEFRQQATLAWRSNGMAGVRFL